MADIVRRALLGAAWRHVGRDGRVAGVSGAANVPDGSRLAAAIAAALAADS